MKTRKIRKSAPIQETIGKEFETAYSDVMKNIDGLIARANELEPKLLNKRKAAEKKLSKIKGNVKKGNGKRKFFTKEDILNINLSRIATRDPYKEALFSEIQKNLKNISACSKCYLENTDHPMLMPGSAVILDGACFGDAQGTVWFEYQNGDAPTPQNFKTIALNIASWSSTQINAFLDLSFDDKPLLPFSGKIWVERSDGTISNSLPMGYKPRYTLYLVSVRDDLSGGAFGRQRDRMALAGEVLNSYFKILKVDYSHGGNGDAGLIAPYAEDRSPIMEQGYHLGVPAFRTSTIDILYQVKGPRNVDPGVHGGNWEILSENF